MKLLEQQGMYFLQDDDGRTVGTVADRETAMRILISVNAMAAAVKRVKRQGNDFIIHGGTHWLTKDDGSAFVSELGRI